MRDVLRMAGPVIWLGLALLIAHELYPVARHEWRLLPGFPLLEDGTGRDVFILFSATMLVTGAIIGAGIFVLSGIAAGEAGQPCCSPLPSTASPRS